MNPTLFAFLDLILYISIIVISFYIWKKYQREISESNETSIYEDWRDIWIRQWKEQAANTMKRDIIQAIEESIEDMNIFNYDDNLI